jgi:NO-binding membrane sensor protein with MHYT domain
MGGIGIWCMHFIGNRAIILGDGSDALQISYSPGFTALSFFIPVIVLFMAFAAVGANEEISLVRLGLGGTLAGLGVCGMHYLGQAGITNYDCVYYVAYVVGAAIIAITAATAALGIFFVFRATWNASWWKRGICAVILAGAVSGMHWLASVGTQYRLKEDAGFRSNNSRNATTISVIVLVSNMYMLHIVTATNISSLLEVALSSWCQPYSHKHRRDVQPTELSRLPSLLRFLTKRVKFWSHQTASC